MKKTLALILSILALLIPVSALELDVAESAEVSVADEAVLAALPETTDATYGDLIYFSDFDENTNWVNTAVVGENATVSFQLAYVQKGNWSSNKVADPKGENGNVQELIVADHNYNWATGFNMSMKNITLDNAVVTMVWDVYFPTPVTENFRVQTSAGWADITAADYDGEAGGWQTIVMNIPGAATVANGEYGFNFICNDGTRNSNKSATAGLTYYIDNVKVYVKDPVYATKPAAVDSTLGNLIYFDNGNSADAVSSDKIGVYGVSDLAVVNGYYAKKLVRDESGAAMPSPGLIIKSANGTLAENGLNGTITILTDVYTSSSLKYYPATDIQYSSSHWGWGSDWYAAGSLTSNTTYTTFKTSVNTSKAVSAFGFMRSENSGSPYARSIAVYYMPATRVTVDGVIVDLHGMTEYTLPEFDTAEYDCYKAANGKFYAPGTYAVADINGKVLTPYLYPKYATKPADVNLGRGILVYYYNGNDADFYSNINATLEGHTDAIYDADGYFTKDMTNKTATGVNGTFVIGLNTGDETKKFAYADGTDMNGSLYMVVDVYNATQSGNSFWPYVRNWSWDAWQGGYTNWGTITAPAGQWYSVSRAYDSEMFYMGFADTNNAGISGVTFRQVYVYYMPRTRITLNDKVNPQVIDLTNKTEYTFPAISDGNTVWKGQNGSYYFPGDVAAVADINGVTFDTANFNGYAPTTDTGVEMRVTSNTATNGIRFKASIAPSKKAAADEAGFIVARGDVLETLGAELTFDLTADGVDNAEGKLFVKGAAYDKAAGKDIVYGATEDGSAEIFTAVCVGIDVTSKAQVNTVLVARPYVKMTVGGKQIAVYGNTNSASLAEVANNLKAAAEAGDEAAANAYNGAKDYIDGVISVGAGK